MAAASEACETAILRKASIRLLPFLMGGYFLAFLDRVNAGFGALQMNRDAGLAPPPSAVAAASSSSAIFCSRCRATCCSSGSARDAGSRGS
ncbi:MAG: major facilitator superfamily 1 [Alphaproteobacteria bacterium]|nr:major facilitator superfamily 1 [Alphaproteobacteria bacterium]